MTQSVLVAKRRARSVAIALSAFAMVFGNLAFTSNLF